MSQPSEHPLFLHNVSLSEPKHCPQCGGQLLLRYGKNGQFLGCDHYPQCDYLQLLHHNDGHIVKPLGIPCPLCAHELVLRQGRYGMFIGCSDYPQCQHIESLEPNEPTMATHVTCPECNKGQLVERISRYGKTFYACNTFPKCKFAINHQPISGSCPRCDYPLLMEKKNATGTTHQCANRKCHYTVK